MVKMRKKYKFWTVRSGTYLTKSGFQIFNLVDKSTIKFTPDIYTYARAEFAWMHIGFCPHLYKTKLLLY